MTAWSLLKKLFNDSFNARILLIFKAKYICISQIIANFRFCDRKKLYFLENPHLRKLKKVAEWIIIFEIFKGLSKAFLPMGVECGY